MTVTAPAFPSSRTHSERRRCGGHGRSLRFSSGLACCHEPALARAGLRGVPNDGRFETKDARGILSFADTAKGDEAATHRPLRLRPEGRLPPLRRLRRPFVGSRGPILGGGKSFLNVIENTKAGSWDTIDAGDLALLETATGGITRGFVLWLPLRCEAVLPAPKLFFPGLLPDRRCASRRPHAPRSRISSDPRGHASP